jgi:hypothetical protein
MDPAAALSNYRALLAKIDAKFAQIQAAHPGSFQCRRGCHGCCQPGLTVSGVERDNLRRYIDAEKGKRDELEELAAAAPHGDSRCAFLAADGACAVHPARPVVCRSHGAPLGITLDSQRRERRLDVCPLNFAGEDLEKLPLGDSIDLDTLNTLLALINQQFAGDAALTRRPLTLTGIMEGPS